MNEVVKFTDFVGAAADGLGLGERPYIRIVKGESAAAATEVELALIAEGAPFYERGGGLVRPYVAQVPASGGRVAYVPATAPVTVPTLVDHVSRVAELAKWDGRAQAYVPADLPENVARIIIDRAGEWNFPSLAAVTTTPTLRSDGTILSQPGYDGATRILLLEPLALPDLPENPTKDDAFTALKLLKGLLLEFPFVNNADRSVALSALLSSVARGALPVVPLHAFNAHVAGTGKSYLASLVAALAIGDHAPVVAIGRNEEETEKRLGATLIAGWPITCIDNVNGELGGDALCQIVERPSVSIRVLGESRMFKGECRTTVLATGNNMQIKGDMTRRTLLCSLDSGLERPELRPFEGKPFDAILADRSRYVAGALTILRAYAVAGYPDPRPPLASFECWSRMVRSALVWLGCDDPCQTMQAARDSDPERSALIAVLAAMRAVMGDGWYPVREIVALADTTGQGANYAPRLALAEALMDVAEHRRGREICPRRFSKWLARFQGRIAEGLRIERREDSHVKQSVWRVVSDFNMRDMRD